MGDGEAEQGDGDAESLYSRLEENVLSLCYDDPWGWAEVMKGAISFNAGAFNTYGWCAATPPKPICWADSAGPGGDGQALG